MRPLSPARLVAAWLVARTVFWTALLHGTQPTLPLDVLEHLAWGREWRLVYAHHPGLPAWINEALHWATGGSRLALSATAPLATSAAMAAVWLLALRLTDARRAAVAALSLEGAWYFHVAAAEFNHNVAQLAACAWLFLLTHRAFVGNDDDAGAGAGKNDWPAWTALGAAAALSLYAKYSSALFLTAALAWSVGEARARRRWRTFGPWLALGIFAALTIPQLVALADLRFAPLRFALQRAGAAADWTHHLVNPSRFAAAQLGAVLPALVLIALARGPATDGSASLSGSSATAKAHRSFVWTAALGPLALALLLSALGGWRFKSMWGAAMISFIPLAALLLLPRRKLHWRRWRAGLVAAAALAALALTAINVGGPHWSGRGKRIHWPAEQMAEHVDAEWRRRFPGAPLRYVVGPKHAAALVAYYAPSRPAAVLDGDWAKNFWATPSAFAESGGAIVWAVNDGRRANIPPPDFAAAWRGRTIRLGDFSAEWKTAAKLPPPILGVMLVAPAAH